MREMSDELDVSSWRGSQQRCFSRKIEHTRAQCIPGILYQDSAVIVKLSEHVEAHLLRSVPLLSHPFGSRTREQLCLRHPAARLP